MGVFHPGTQHSWQTALAFQEVGRLAWYATSIFYDPNRWPYKIERFVPPNLASRVNREFRRRHAPALDLSHVRQFGFWEWSETLARRFGQERMAGFCNEKGNRTFCRQVIRLIEREPVDLVWGFNSSSLEVFEWARKRGIRCVLDQTIGHPATQNQVMLEEQARHPEFFVSSYRPYPRSWMDRQNAEVAEADWVVVGSDYCATTMIQNGCPPEKIRVLPYGYDESAFAGQENLRSTSNRRPVNCLFVGEIGPRKGVSYLLQAFAEIPAEQAELTLVGRLLIPPGTFRKYAHRVKHVPQVPRAEVSRYFGSADCFVFPSLFEGGGIVLYEACAAGLGIIQTNRCGDGVRDGQNGVVLQKVSVESVVNAVRNLVTDAGMRDRWKRNSLSRCQERTWKNYRKRAVQLMQHG